MPGTWVEVVETEKFILYLLLKISVYTGDMGKQLPLSEWNIIRAMDKCYENKVMVPPNKND